MKKYLVFFFFAIIYACKPHSETTEVKQDIPADFIAFYDRFSYDSSFQMSSIIFPLEGRPAMVDGMTSIPANFRWQQKDWLLHKQYDDGNGTFSRSFTVFGDIITEDISDASGKFTMVRRFAKTSDGWRLIYYKEMGL